MGSDRLAQGRSLATRAQARQRQRLCCRWRASPAPARGARSGGSLFKRAHDHARECVPLCVYACMCACDKVAQSNSLMAASISTGARALHCACGQRTSSKPRGPFWCAMGGDSLVENPGREWRTFIPFPGSVPQAASSHSCTPSARTKGPPAHISHRSQVCGRYLGILTTLSLTRKILHLTPSNVVSHRTQDSEPSLSAEET